MALVMTPIYTQTVGAGGAVSIFFNNIPQFYTDLVIRMSARQASAAVTSEFYFFVNADNATIHSTTWLFGTGSAAGSGRAAGNTAIVQNFTPAANATPNSFGLSEITIPNYTSNNFKQFIIDQVSENNATAADGRLNAGLIRTASPISVIRIDSVGTFAQHSTFSLYGIIRSGA